MAIRIANANEIKDIAKKQKKNNIAKEELNLSEEELTFLYSKALEELKDLNSSMGKFKDELNDFFWSKEIFDLDIIKLFFVSLSELINSQLPDILEGNYDSIAEISDFNSDDMDNIRINLYRTLSEKYLKNK